MNQDFKRNGLPREVVRNMAAICTSLPQQMRLDHAFCVPQWKVHFEQLPAISPIVTHPIQKPVPGVACCMSFGEQMTKAC